MLKNHFVSVRFYLKDTMRIFLWPLKRQIFKMCQFVQRRSRVLIALLLGILIGVLFQRFHSVELDDSFDTNDRIHSYIQSDRSAQMTNRVHISRRLHLKYLDEYRRKVDGWIDHEIFYFVWLLSQYQYNVLDKFGSIGEIGVHHGKFTCYLYLMRRYEEQTLFAVDVFDNQLLNKDGSGHGQKDIFLRNSGMYTYALPDQIIIYAGSSLDLNPIFSKQDRITQWWIDKVLGTQGIQIISVDGGHTGLLTYSDVCLASNSIIDGGLVIVDDITHPGWLGVRDGVGRFLAETSSPIIDEQLENDLQKSQNRSSIDLSKRIVKATKFRDSYIKKGNCSRLIPFLQCFNKLFLTTPDFYPKFIDLLVDQSFIPGSTAAEAGTEYLKYNALRLTIGHVPIWTENFDLTRDQLTNIFKNFIEPKWMKLIQESDHHFRVAKDALK